MIHRENGDGACKYVNTTSGNKKLDDTSKRVNVREKLMVTKKSRSGPGGSRQEHLKRLIVNCE
jgi:hypothetical protein